MTTAEVKAIENPNLPAIPAAMMDELMRAGKIAATAFLLAERDLGERLEWIPVTLTLGTASGPQQFYFSIERSER